jgi:hypothetical protein
LSFQSRRCTLAAVKNGRSRRLRRLGTSRQLRFVAKRERQEHCAAKRELEEMSKSWDAAAEGAEEALRRNRESTDGTTRGTPSGRKSERSFKVARRPTRALASTARVDQGSVIPEQPIPPGPEPVPHRVANEAEVP